MRVYGYARVSSEEQATSGQSLAAQAEKIRLYCQLHDLDLVEIIEDPGFSAKDLKRPGITRALEGLRAGEVEGLVIVKIDRLSRSLRDWSRLIESDFSERSGKALLMIEDSIDTRTAGGRLVLHLLASVSQWEREVIGERTRSVLRHKRARGEPVSRAPRGLRVVREGVTDTSPGRAVGFIVDPENEGLQIAARAREMRAEGRTLRQIADLLTVEGFKPERADRFSSAGIWYILRNPRLADHAAA